MPAAADDPNALPVPMGVRVDTGAVCPPMTAADAARIAAGRNPSAVALARANGQTSLGHDGSVSDPNNLSQTGWCVLFASDADPAIRQQLQPLLDLRERQVQRRVVPGRAPLFRTFAGSDPNTGGVGLNADGTPQTAFDWTKQHGASLYAPVNPSIVPYYVLIVGSPERIPFSFQQDLKSQWLVGRLYFDDIADYGRYAAQVIAQEPDPATPNVVLPSQLPKAAVWITSNQGDVPTMVLSGALTGDFQGTDGVAQGVLGSAWGFSVDFSLIADATKARLQDVLSGARGAASVLFTGSHGAETAPPVTDDDSAHQRSVTGALITQAWIPGQDVTDDCFFKAEDIPATNILPGMMVFMFACFSAGCPAIDSYRANDDGSAITVAKAPFIAKLAQAMLSHGALAVIGHVDRAYKYGFVSISGTSQVQAFRTPLEILMQVGSDGRGNSVGLAADSFSSTEGTLSVLMQRMGSTLAAPALVRMHIASDDARNYIVLGDPATRLRLPSAS